MHGDRPLRRRQMHPYRGQQHHVIGSLETIQFKQCVRAPGHLSAGMESPDHLTQLRNGLHYIDGESGAASAAASRPVPAPTSKARAGGWGSKSNSA